MELLPICHKYGVDLVSLIAPTSENRIAMIAKEAEGFLYIVSSLGVTGTRSEIKTDLGFYSEGGKAEYISPMRDRLWNLNAPAGKEDGRHLLTAQSSARQL